MYMDGSGAQGDDEPSWDYCGGLKEEEKTMRTKPNFQVVTQRA
jgi:hypothetical protein